MKTLQRKGMEAYQNGLYWILGRAAQVTFQFFTGTIEKVIKFYEEQRNDWSIRKVSCVFRYFYILLHTNRL